MDEPALTLVLTVAVLGFLGVRLASGVRVATSTRGRRLAGSVLRRVGWRHVWPVPLVLVTVLTAAVALMRVPGLSWGWWAALGGEGNPVFGSTDTTAGTALEWVLPLAFIGLLLPALPLFAHAEERMFRAGAEAWSGWRRVLRTLQFGLVHALIGIPLGAALALSIGGAWFMAVYLRTQRRTGSRAEATLEAAAAHTVYNATIIGLVLVALALTAAGV